MLTMNEFYKLLFASSDSLAPSLKALRVFTRIGRSQLISIARDLSWQAW